MTTILFNLVLFALALDLILWGIDQGWSLVNRYKTSQELKAELLTKRWLDLCKEKQNEEEAQKQRDDEIQKWGQTKPKVNVVPMWHHKHEGGDSDGHGFKSYIRLHYSLKVCFGIPLFFAFFYKK